MYRLVFVQCKDGKHLTREPGPWHPDFAVSKKWYDFWINFGYSPKVLRIEHIAVGDDGRSTLTTVDPDSAPGQKAGGGADADLLAALSSMA
jgi:hypothetical protein